LLQADFRAIAPEQVQDLGGALGGVLLLPENLF
jgi:hypothetical protein